MEPEKLMALCKRRGFFWQAFELYGGARGLYDYGPLGALLKHNFQDIWKRHYVVGEGFFEIDSPNLSPEDVFAASGHLAEFSDYMVQCQECSEAFRADHLVEKVAENPDSLPPEELSRLIKDNDIKCQRCGGGLGEPESFNLMFKSAMGAGKGRTAYLRPETAQGIFVNFQGLYRYGRDKLPFGVVQLGRGYRNEIAPRQGLLRMREFNMAEVEVFVRPEEKTWPLFFEVAGDKTVLVANTQAEGQGQTMTFAEAVENKIIANEAVAYFMARTRRILLEAGVDDARLRFRQHLADEMAHYASDCWDAEALLGYGWVELVGIADRGSFDLSAHIKHSGRELAAFDRYDEPKEMEVTEVRPNISKLGPAFKGKAKAIAAGLEALDAGDIPAEGPATVTVDGEEHTIERDYFQVVTETRKETGRWFVPHVIEPSYGVDRILYTVLDHSITEGKDAKGEPYTVLKLPPGVAPIKVGVFPLMSKPELAPQARKIEKFLKDAGLVIMYDDSGSIGRRYARADEVGVPFCVTIDYEGLEDATATIRDRDTTRQKRFAVNDIPDAVRELLAGRVDSSCWELPTATDDA